MNINDTTAEARKVQIDIYHRMTVEKKLKLIFSAYRTGRLLAMAGIRMQQPDATEEQIWRSWAKQHLGEKLFNEVYGTRQ